MAAYQNVLKENKREKKQERKRVITSLDFFIIALVLLTLAALIFRTQLAGLFSAGGEEQDVYIGIECESGFVDSVRKLSAGESVRLSGRALRVVSVTLFEDETQSPKASVVLSGRASRGGDGIWRVSGTQIRTGVTASLKLSSGSAEVWVISVTPSAPDPSAAPSQSAAPASLKPIAAA